MAEEQTHLTGVETWRFISSFDEIDPYRWFTILPYGKFRRFGRRVEITREMVDEMVRNFRVMPPRELGVNKEHLHEFGKIGNIAALRAGRDGLEAVIGWFETGLQAVQEKAFQYFSVEVIFDEYDLDGKFFKNFLTGLAVTNDPYFGSLTAMFTAQDRDSDLWMAGSGPIDEVQLSEGDLQMDANIIAEGIEKFVQKFGAKNPETPPAVPAPAVTAEEFESLKAERDRLAQEKAEIERQAAEAAKTARVAQFKAQLPKLPEVAEKLALIEDGEMADYLAQQFAALGNQVDEGALLGEQGSAGGHAEDRTPADEFAALVEARKAEGMKPAEALRSVAAEHPKLYRAYTRESGSRKANDADD